MKKIIWIFGFFCMIFTQILSMEKNKKLDDVIFEHPQMKEIIDEGQEAAKKFEEAFLSGNEAEMNKWKDIFNDCLDQGEQQLILLREKLPEEK